MIAQRASELTLSPIDWLWPGQLAVGNLAILDGDPGIGKSMLTLDLAARITNGRDWPDGAAGAAPGNVIYLFEEDPDNVVDERIRALGVDRGRISLWPRDQLPQFPTDIKLLEEDVRDFGAKLVIIDPIMAFLDRSVGVCNDVDVRRALRSLAGVAHRHHCTILMVRHLNKKPGHNALYRGSGSIAFVAVCRLAWLAGRDPRVRSRCVLAQPKNNFAARHKSLAYTLPEDKAGIEWLGSCTVSADELGMRRRARPVRDRIIEFLQALLADGPKLASEVWTAVQKEGFSQKTVERAKKDLGIRSQTVPGKGMETTYWLLEDQLLPADKTIDPEVDRFVMELKKTWPVRTPLD
jgi:hypothetical protein